MDNASLLHLAFWHQSTEWQCHVTAYIQTDALCGHTLTHTHTPPHMTSYKAVGKIYGQNVGDTFSHTKSRHAQTHTCRTRTISSVSDSTK